MRPIPLLTLALVAAAGPLAGQTPAERLRLDSIQASFAAVSDTGALLALERTRIEVARRHRDDPLIHMELGYLAYRLGELTDEGGRYADAAVEFHWAGTLRPRWPYPQYFEGQCELARGESRIVGLENLRQITGTDRLSRAARAFARAVDRDPQFTPALVALAQAALDQRVRSQVDGAMRGLREAATRPATRTPATLLLLGRLERRAGHPDSALAAFRAFLAAGGDRHVGLVESARALAALNQGDSAVAVYRQALAPPMTEAGRAELGRDLRWIGNPDELATYDSLALDAIGDFVTAFWRRRQVDDARQPGERLLEQFRRYGYAVANFSIASRHRVHDLRLGYRDTTQGELDDRGVIYMRHGAPDARARGVVDSTYVQTWVYRRYSPEPNLILSFAAIRHAYDYRLVSDVGWLCSSVDYCDALVPYDPATYFRLRHAGMAAPRYAAAARLDAIATIDSATRSDSYRLAFPRELWPVLSTFQVADASLRTELHLVFAVPARDLRSSDPNAPAGRLRVSVLVFDDERHEVASLETSREFARPAGNVPGNAYVTSHVALTVPPGAWRYHFTLEDAGSGAGALLRGRAVDVRRLDAGFTASDVILGREGSGLVWARPDGDVPLNPLASFPAGDHGVVYYELYGLPRGAGITTSVALRPVRRGALDRLARADRSVDFSYVTVTDGDGIARVRQRFDLADLDPGSYLMSVDLLDPVSGRTVHREAPFDIERR